MPARAPDDPPVAATGSTAGRGGTRARETGLRWALAVGWSAVLWIALTLPPRSFGDPSWLPLLASYGLDKAGHFAVFAAHAWLLHRALRRTLRFAPALAAACLLTAGYAVLTEQAQRRVAGRDAALADLAADLAGSAAYAAVAPLRRRRGR